MRDYTAWEGDAEAQNVAFLKPYVWDWMHFSHFYTGNFRHSWVIDASYGIEHIAHYVAHSVDEDETYSEIKALKHRNMDCDGDKECQWWQEQGRGFIYCVEGAIRELIDEGKVEIALEFGWPVLRLTMGNLPPQVLGGSATFNEREARMRKRFDDLRTMPYPEYLKTDEWRYRREIHLEAAGNRCQLCNSDEQPLHVHHRTYANRGRERFYDLVVLCGPCHEWFHKSGRKIR